MGTLSRKYHAISPLLIKVEGLVVHTNSGKSPFMKRYYAYWERKVFDALVKVQWMHNCRLDVVTLYTHVHAHTVELW